MSILCRHACTITMRCCVKEIPEISHQSDSRDRENVKLISDSYYSFESCLDTKQQISLKEFESDYTYGGLKSKTDGEVICKLMNVFIPNPEEINIHVPYFQSNKCSEIKKRISSAGETIYVNSKKEHRMCLTCGERVPHNLRTYPVRIATAQSTKDI
uniref:Uncharacterized protein n=1 Tax=Lactuca sativa TaxID=4236 RepID=A0A9R1V3E8_LACSA|nr:hypothetical protein LSAT_V11C700381430 [Lactuca sativa]